MRRPILLIIVVGVCICVVCIAAVAVLVGGILAVTQPVVDAGDAFLTAIQNEDYAGAYALMDSSLQKELGGVENFQTNLVQVGIAPSSWSFGSRSIENNTGEVSGTVTMADGSEYDVTLNFVKSGDDWLVVGYNFVPTASE